MYKSLLSKNFKTSLPKYFKIKVKCGSNIALVKYWGKKSTQIPLNPSISFTLKEAYTETILTLSQSEKPYVKVFLNGIETPSFIPKINNFFSLLKKESWDFLENYNFNIETINSFPYGAGIASSASGFGALAYGLAQFVNTSLELAPEDLYRFTSYIARLGSGSACRSIYGGVVSWGEGINDGNNQYASPIKSVHSIFQDYRDIILIVSNIEKKVSSTIGHKLMDNHPYSNKRIDIAHSHAQELIKALQLGDVDIFIKIVEAEALDIHAIMMTSTPPFILFKPQTIAIIEEVWDFRQKTGLPLAFSLDAGANVHLLFPKNITKEVLYFIQNTLKPYYYTYIYDKIGSAPHYEK